MKKELTDLFKGRKFQKLKILIAKISLASPGKLNPGHLVKLKNRNNKLQNI